MFTINAQPLESFAMAVLGLFTKREHLLNSITQVREGQGIYFTKCIRGSTCVYILEVKKSWIGFYLSIIYDYMPVSDSFSIFSFLFHLVICFSSKLF